MDIAEMKGEAWVKWNMFRPPVIYYGKVNYGEMLERKILRKDLKILALKWYV